MIMHVSTKRAKIVFNIRRIVPAIRYLHYLRLNIDIHRIPCCTLTRYHDKSRYRITHIDRVLTSQNRHLIRRFPDRHSCTNFNILHCAHIRLRQLFPYNLVFDASATRVIQRFDFEDYYKLQDLTRIRFYRSLIGANFSWLLSLTIAYNNFFDLLTSHANLTLQCYYKFFA